MVWRGASEQNKMTIKWRGDTIPHRYLKFRNEVLINKKIPPSVLKSTQRDNLSRWIKFVEPNAKWVRLLIYSNFQLRPVVQNRNGGPLTVFNHGSGIVSSSSKLWSQRHPLMISRPVVTLAESTLGNRQNKFSKSSRRNKKPASHSDWRGLKFGKVRSPR